MSAPGGVVILRVSGTETFAPDDVVGGIHDAIIVEITGCRTAKPRLSEFRIQHEIQQRRTDLLLARLRRMGPVAAEIALLPDEPVTTRIGSVSPKIRAQSQPWRDSGCVAQVTGTRIDCASVHLIDLGLNQPLHGKT